MAGLLLIAFLAQVFASPPLKLGICLKDLLPNDASFADANETHHYTRIKTNFPSALPPPLSTLHSALIKVSAIATSTASWTIAKRLLIARQESAIIQPTFFGSTMEVNKIESRRQATNFGCLKR